MQQIATIPQEAVSLHSHIAGHLLHPRFVRVNGDPGDHYPAALEMDEEQHVVGHQPTQREHLRGEKVGPRQQRQMDANEGRPRARALALRSRRQSVAPQDIANRLIANHMPEIGQSTHNPVIAPGPVLPGHAYNQLLDLKLDPRSSWTATGFRAVELAGDKLAVPSQDGVWPRYSCDLGEGVTAQAMSDLTERGSLGVREFEPSFQLVLQDAVFGGQIFVPRHEFLIHRPRDVGQDARPIHNGSPCPDRPWRRSVQNVSQWPPESLP